MQDGEQATVGIVGLGAMGSRMARRLLDANYSVVGHDTEIEAMEPLAAQGLAICDSAQDVADRAPVVLVSLPSPQIVEQVACDELVKGRAITTYVDLSTTGPPVAERVSGVLDERGIACLDAPVSGGAVGADSGTLTIMASGAAETLKRVRPFLEQLGSTIIHVGELPGQAQTVKLANNLLSATAIAATAEVLLIGAKSGIDPATMLDAFNGSSGRNTATTHKFPKFVLPRTFDSDFRLSLMAKDVRLCVEEAARQSIPLKVGATVDEVWSTAAREMSNDTDATAIVTRFEAAAGAILEGGRNGDLHESSTQEGGVL